MSFLLNIIGETKFPATNSYTINELVSCQFSEMKIITCITFVLSFRTERSIVKNLESIAQLKRGCYRDSSLRSE